MLWQHQIEQKNTTQRPFRELWNLLREINALTFKLNRLLLLFTVRAQSLIPFQLHETFKSLSYRADIKDRQWLYVNVDYRWWPWVFLFIIVCTAGFPSDTICWSESLWHTSHCSQLYHGLTYFQLKKVIQWKCREILDLICREMTAVWKQASVWQTVQ